MLIQPRPLPSNIDDDDIRDSIEWARDWLDKAQGAVGNEGLAVQENLLNARARIQQLLDWYARGEYPAIYILDPIGVDGALEANGTVFVYCSEACRTIAIIERGVESDPPHRLGASSDWVDGAVCDECGIKLP